MVAYIAIGAGIGLLIGDANNETIAGLGVGLVCGALTAVAIRTITVAFGFVVSVVIALICIAQLASGNGGLAYMVGLLVVLLVGPLLYLAHVRTRESTDDGPD